MKRERTASYIYTNGTLVELFDEMRNGVKVGETADITLGYCKLDIGERSDTHGRTHQPHGRIVVHNRYRGKGFVELAKGGYITAMVPTLAEGSPNTQKRGIKVQYVKLTTKAGHTLAWTDTDILSSEFTVQAEPQFECGVNPDSCHVGFSWGGSRIWKITDLRPKPEAAEIAA